MKFTKSHASQKLLHIVTELHKVNTVYFVNLHVHFQQIKTISLLNARVNAKKQQFNY